MRGDRRWALSTELLGFLEARLSLPGTDYFDALEAAAVALTSVMRLVASSGNPSVSFDEAWAVLTGPEAKEAMRGVFMEERKDSPS